MAFLLESGDEKYFFLDRYIGSNRRLKAWVYITTDDRTTVTTAGYFDDIEFAQAVMPGDRITVLQATDRNDLSTEQDKFEVRVTSIAADSFEVDLVADLGLIATQAQAEAGTSNGVLMTPLRTAQEIQKRTDYYIPEGLVLNDSSATGNAAILHTALTAAVAAGKILLLPAGTIWVSDHDADTYAWEWITGARIKGHGKDVTTIKLKDASNCHVCGGIDITDLHLEDFTVSGNKANQSIGSSNPWRCVYLQGEVHRVYGRQVVVRDAVDHGWHFSDGGTVADETGRVSRLVECEAHDCGSAAHNAAGGPGGTGMGTGTFTCILDHCWATGNYLNGFKSGAGTFLHCISENNSGGFETGFATPEYEGATFINCIAQDNAGDGFRHQGQGDYLRMYGCWSERNGASGITMLNVVNDFVVRDCVIRDNGQDPVTFPRSATTGLDGLSILSSSVNGPRNGVIDGNTFEDTQTGVETQEYGIYLDDDVGSLVITKTNKCINNKTQALFVALDGDEDVTIEAFIGYSARYKDISTSTAPADTATNVLKTHDILGNERHNGGKYRVTASGTCTGTAGTKIVRLGVGGSTVVITSQSAGEQQLWYVDALIELVDSTVYWVSAKLHENGGTSSASGFSVSVAFGSALTIFISATKGDAADTITCETFHIDALN